MSMNVEPREFRVAKPIGSGRARLVLVTDIPEEGVANVMLVADSTDVISTEDALLYRHETGLPFDIVVETDVVGCVYVNQLSPPLGKLTMDIGAILDIRRSRGGIYTPMFLKHWKENELADMHNISYHCFVEKLGTKTRDEGSRNS